MFNFFPQLFPRALGLRLVCGLTVCCALVALDMLRRDALPPVPQAVWPAGAGTAPNRSLVAVARGQIPMPANTPTAHASALLPMPPTHPAALMAFWFAGARESAADVQIAASQFDRASQQWSAARFVVNRQVMGDQLGYCVRRLGNPVAWRDAQGKIHLFVVATGLGGWAAGRILHLRQSDDGQDFKHLSFDSIRVLPLSWLWNTSFLVRATPLPLADGGMILPVYFELGLKYPAALRFDALGEFKGLVRISRRGHLLQPTLLMLTESRWLALMRDNSRTGKVAAAQTDNGGQDWVDLPDLSLDNPDASIMGLSLQPGELFLAHNSSPTSRIDLDLSRSHDGRNWKLAHILERGTDPSEFSYPALAWADNNLWVSYTDHRRHIAWQRFALTPSSP